MEGNVQTLSLSPSLPSWLPLSRSVCRSVFVYMKMHNWHRRDMYIAIACWTLSISLSLQTQKHSNEIADTWIEPLIVGLSGESKMKGKSGLLGKFLGADQWAPSTTLSCNKGWRFEFGLGMCRSSESVSVVILIHILWRRCGEHTSNAWLQIDFVLCRSSGSVSVVILIHICWPKTQTQAGLLT